MKIKRLFLYLITLTVIAGCTKRTESDRAPAATNDTLSSTQQLVDLTYPFNDSTIYWPTAKGFELTEVTEGMTDKGYFYSTHRLSTSEHGGTHIDAPYHFWKEGKTVDEIPVDQLMGRAIVVNVRDSALANPNYQIRKADFKQWEQEYGSIPEGAIVLLKTGYGRYWPDKNKYMGTDERGAEAVSKLHFPGLHPAAAEWIATKRNIKMIGIDTPSIDYGQSTHFQSHVTLFKNNIPALENVANLEELPAKGFTLIALPIKTEGGSGGPVRIVARW